MTRQLRGQAAPEARPVVQLDPRHLPLAELWLVLYDLTHLAYGDVDERLLINGPVRLPVRAVDVLPAGVLPVRPLGPHS